MARQRAISAESSPPRSRAATIMATTQAGAGMAKGRSQGDTAAWRGKTLVRVALPRAAGRRHLVNVKIERADAYDLSGRRRRTIEHSVDRRAIALKIQHFRACSRPAPGRSGNAVRTLPAGRFPSARIDSIGFHPIRGGLFAVASGVDRAWRRVWLRRRSARCCRPAAVRCRCAQARSLSQRRSGHDEAPDPAPRSLRHRRRRQLRPSTSAITSTSAEQAAPIARTTSPSASSIRS